MGNRKGTYSEIPITTQYNGDNGLVSELMELGYRELFSVRYGHGKYLTIHHLYIFAGGRVESGSVYCTDRFQFLALAASSSQIDKGALFRFPDGSIKLCTCHSFIDMWGDDVNPQKLTTTEVMEYFNLKQI